MSLAIIVPILNEATQLPDLISHLLHWQQRGCDVVIVDGGSRDKTVELLQASGLFFICADKGRANQMNAGAKVVQAETLLFLHADTRLPPEADRHIKNSVRLGYRWGRFDVTIDGNSMLFLCIAFLINLRSRLTGIATGDQAIFVKRDLFFAVEGFPDQPLMEDIELAKQLKNKYPPHCLRVKVLTSGRRWQTHGVMRTVLLMWGLRLGYWLGISAEQLAKKYHEK